MPAARRDPRHRRRASASLGEARGGGTWLVSHDLEPSVASRSSRAVCGAWRLALLAASQDANEPGRCERRRRFLSPAPNLRLATLDPDGGPQRSTAWRAHAASHGERQTPSGSPAMSAIHSWRRTAGAGAAQRGRPLVRREVVAHERERERGLARARGPRRGPRPRARGERPRRDPRRARQPGSDRRGEARAPRSRAGARGRSRRRAPGSADRRARRARPGRRARAPRGRRRRGTRRRGPPAGRGRGRRRRRGRRARRARRRGRGRRAPAR